ncbi:flagellar hook-length control protein FliK [Marinomonas sp. 2405UD68-3]|uniref:flagellar hook-length control protein FliK n=1 Tax=Marinomonas sp. 2405UD68-3 TaxID=3391835 RepID=UPI0039C9818A
MQMQLDTTIPLSSNKSSSRPFGESRAAPLRDRGSFAEVLETTRKQSPKREAPDNSKSNDPSGAVDNESQAYFNDRKLHSKREQRDDVQNDRSLPSKDAPLKSLNKLDSEAVKDEGNSNLAGVGEDDAGLLNENNGKNLPIKEAAFVVNDNSLPIVEDQSDLGSVSLQVPSPINIEETDASKVKGDNDGLIPDDTLALNDKDAGPSILDLDIEQGKSSDLDAFSAIGEPLLDSKVKSHTESNNAVTLSLSDEVSIPSSTVLTLNEKLESLSLNDEVLNSENVDVDVDVDVDVEGAALKQPVIVFENIKDVDVSAPFKNSDVSLDIDAKNHEGSLNLAWVFGEMKRQGAVVVKENADVIVDQESESLSLKSQNVLFSKLTQNSNNSGSLVDVNALLSNNEVSFDGSLKNGNKASLEVLSEFSLLVDEELPVEPSELLKNSKLFDSQLEEISNADSKLITTLGTAIGGPSLAVTSQGIQTSTQQPVLTMTVPPNDPKWSQEMGEKVRWIMREGVQTAEIHLDPPELGSLGVKVSLDGDVASITFSAATPQARDLLESQLQRLREQLAQQGVDLEKVDVNVSQQNQGQESSSNEGRGGGKEVLDNDDDSFLEENTSYVNASGVDYYA